MGPVYFARMYVIYHMFSLGWNWINYYLAINKQILHKQPITTEGEELDDLDHDPSEVWIFDTIYRNFRYDIPPTKKYCAYHKTLAAPCLNN